MKKVRYKSLKNKVFRQSGYRVDFEPTPLKYKKMMQLSKRVCLLIEG
jgi:hypothetical protein